MNPGMDHERNRHVREVARVAMQTNVTILNTVNHFHDFLKIDLMLLNRPGNPRKLDFSLRILPTKKTARRQRLSM